MNKKSILERLIDVVDIEQMAELPRLFGDYLLIGASHWLTGQTGIGKSTISYNIVHALAEGTDLWGIPCEQSNVLYVDLETGDALRKQKVEKLYNGKERSKGRFIFARDRILFPGELDEFLSVVQKMEISLVIFDTVRRCFQVENENDNAEVYLRIVPTLDALKNVGIASLTIGHPCKNGGTTARGAGAQEDAGDINLTLTMHKSEVSDPNGIIALSVTKSRLLGLGIPPLYLRRIGEDRFQKVEIDGSEIDTEKQTQTLQAKCSSDIVEYLADAGENIISYTELLTAMLEKEYTESTIKRAMKKLENSLTITKQESGGYRLTDLDV